MLLSPIQAGFGFQELEMILLGLLSKRSYRELLLPGSIPRFPDYITSCELYYYLNVTFV